VAGYIERYAVHHDLPVRTSTRVESLDQLPDGRFRLRLTAGELTCDNVVVATGTFGQTPRIPDIAANLDPSIHQLHSSAYQRPGQIPPGRVLVVGASHSGTDIAYELAESHPVTLCGHEHGQLPLKPEQRRARLMFPVIVFVWRHVLTRRTPVGRKVMNEVRFHGAPMIRVHREDLAEREVERRLGRLTGTQDGLPMLEDGTVVDASTVLWATGFRQVFDWILIPIIGEDGWPAEMRGVVEKVPGLFFCGLAFQYAFSSMVFPGIGRDAEYLVRQIDARVSAAAKPLPEQFQAV
jgi:putative flavoprotein involved in K+ transport